VPGRGEHVERKTVVDVQAEAVRTLKAGGAVSKPQLDAAVDVLKALKVEAGAAARRLQQSIGAGPDGAAREEIRQAVVNTLRGSSSTYPHSRSTAASRGSITTVRLGAASSPTCSPSSSR
jgi:hypothetical protein